MGIRGSAGTLVDLRNPDPQAFQPAPIARTLSYEHRYGGNYGPYSVAQHAVLVADVVELLLWDGQDIVGMPRPEYEHTCDEVNRYALSGLHHDDTEAVTGDLPKPVKNACPDFRELEADLQRAVDARYDIETGHEIVKRADRIVFAAEVLRLVPPEARWMYAAEIADVTDKELAYLTWTDLVPWPADEAYARYMDAHERYSR